MTVSQAGVLDAAPRALSSELTLAGTGTASFSATIDPRGRATTAFFQFGLAARYREPRPRGPVYDEPTPAVHLAAGRTVFAVAGRVGGLVPNALYNLRLVASSAAGTVYSPEATFRTLRDPPPRPPRIAATMNLAPLSGLVLLRLPRQRLPRQRLPRAAAVATVGEGSGFIPLTESRQLPIGSQIDARAGALRLSVARAHGRGTQRVTLAGAVVSISQTWRGPGRGMTTISLLEGGFAGAPTYDSCPAVPSSSQALQTLRVRAPGERLQTRGRYSTTAARVPGAAWDTIDRCDGTLTVVHRGTVTVSDPRLHRTITVDAGTRYLARAQ